MPKLRFGGTSSASSGSSVDSTLLVESNSSEPWLFGLAEADAGWQERRANSTETLYQVCGRWVLHRVEDGQELVHLSTETIPHPHATYRVGGLARQVDRRQATEWLVKYRYPLPLELQDLQAEATAKFASWRDTDIQELERETPQLETKSVEWIAARKENEKKLGLLVATLRTYRLASSGGRKMPDEMFGIDRDGRRWRRQGTPKSMVYYFVSSLPKVSNKASN